MPWRRAMKVDRMPLADMLRYLVLALLTSTLVWAAFTDIMARRIPNRAVLVILCLYAGWLVLSRGTGLWSALGAGVLSFIIGYILYLFKVMGAGDVKLFAAVALFAGLNYLPLLALATAISGGLVAGVNMLVRPYVSQAVLTLQGKEMAVTCPTVLPLRLVMFVSSGGQRQVCYRPIC
jgi:prepilin peptidase CpaA